MAIHDLLDNFTPLLRLSDKEAVFHDLYAPIENGTFLIADRTTTSDSLIIFATLLNVSTLMLIERHMSYRHVFFSVFIWFAFFRYPLLKMSRLSLFHHVLKDPSRKMLFYESENTVF